MAVYKTDSGSWVASSRQVWLPGSYQTEKAARLAYHVDPGVLSDAWEAKRDADGVIHDDFTEDEMQELVRKTKKEGE